MAEKIPERPRRIESLGLAVVPWQAYPLMALIREMDDMLREEARDRLKKAKSPMHGV